MHDACALCPVRLADSLRAQHSKKQGRDFPGGPVVKNPPYNAGDMGLIPGQGTKIPYAVGQLSPHHNY